MATNAAWVEPGRKVELEVKMQIIYNTLCEMQGMANMDARNKQDYEELVSKLDQHTEMLLKGLNYKQEPHVSLFKQTDDQRLTEAQKDLAAVAGSPITALSYAVEAISRSIQADIGKDLLAFASEFKFAGCLSFRISFLSFGPEMMASSTNPISGKKEGMKQLEKMKALGYQIREKKHRFGYEMIDSDGNRGLITMYLKNKFKARTIEFRSRNGVIDYAAVWMDLSGYEPVAHAQGGGDTHASAEPLTDDEMVHLKKTIGSYQFALANYMQMNKNGAGNLVLGVIEGYMYELEQLTGCHGIIFERKEAEYAGPRKINGEIHNIQNDIKSEAVKIATQDTHALYNGLHDKLVALVKPLGLYPLEFDLQEYQVSRFTLSMDSLPFSRKEPVLETIYDKHYSSTRYFLATKKNIEIISELLRSVMPSCEMESFETGNFDGINMVLRKVIFVTHSASDLQALAAYEPGESDEE